MPDAAKRFSTLPRARRPSRSRREQAGRGSIAYSSGINTEAGAKRKALRGIGLDERVEPAQNRWVKTLALFLCLSMAGVSALPALAENPAPDPSLCGPFPKIYKEIIWNWMQNN